MLSTTLTTLALIRRAAFPALGFVLILYFVGNAIIGDNGILAWGDYRQLKMERTAKLAMLDAEKARLTHRATLLDPRRADPDLADELVRGELGLVRPDEVIVTLPE